MTNVGVVLAIAGILFIFAGLTGAAVWWSNGKVTAYLKSNPLRLTAVICGLLLVSAAIYLEVNKQQKALSIDEFKILIKPLEDKMIQQQDLTRKNESAIAGQRNELTTLFTAVSSLDAGINQSYTDQHSNLLRVVDLLAKHDHSLGCTKTEFAYQNYIPSGTSLDICDHVSALRYAVSIHLKDGVDAEKLQNQFLTLGQPAYITTDKDSESGIADPDLAIVFPEGAPRELICLVHGQFQERVVGEGNANRIIPYLLSTKELGQSAGSLGQSRYAIGLGKRIGGLRSILKPMTAQAWRDICNSKYSQEGFEDFVNSLLKPLS